MTVNHIYLRPCQFGDPHQSKLFNQWTMTSELHSKKLHAASEQISEATELIDALIGVQEIYDIDFTTYHLAHTISDIVDTPFVRTTYKDAWIARYLLRGYVRIDPVVQEGLVRQLPFDWREIEVKDSAVRAFMLDARKHGVAQNGFSIPIIDKSRRALLTLNSSMDDTIWTARVKRYRSEWIEVAQLIHRKAILQLYGARDPILLLGQRELECLHWAALGNDAKGISTILSLSQHTVKTYLKSARHKLGCITTAAATTKARHLRLIHPYGNTLI